MAREVHTNLNFVGGAKVTGLPAGSNSGEPIVYEQFNAALEGIAWKDDVKAASTANINLSSPGASIDGVSMSAGDRFLAKNQTTGSENGIYIWNGSAVAATRATDMSASSEFNSAVVPVKPGGTANANTTWRCTTADPTVGTTTIVFTSFIAASAAADESTAGIAEVATQTETDTGTDDARMVTPLKLKNWAGGPKRYASDVGDGSATSFTLTHNLNTRDVNVLVRRNSGNYDEIICDVNVLTVNTVQLIFASAPTAAQFRTIVTA